MRTMNCKHRSVEEHRANPQALSIERWPKSFYFRVAMGSSRGSIRPTGMSQIEEVERRKQELNQDPYGRVLLQRPK